MLAVADFAAFFREVHGFDPFPWQRLLLQRIAGDGQWPATLDLPTGAGKTAAIDIAVFHLALEATRGHTRRAPVRIAFVVDRRLVVDDAFEHARRLEAALLDPPGPVSTAVAAALRALAQDGPPLVARRLRGGIAREDDWARTPAQPTVLCSTVDQVGSRLLFRGYGVTDAMKPVHAGLIGADCLILLDEAHLAEPFRQTLEWAGRYRGANWRECEHSSPWGMALLTATPGQEGPGRFALDQDPHDQDSAHPILARRLQASKPARLLLVDGEPQRRKAFIDEVRKALGTGARAIGVVVNRVAKARGLFGSLRAELDSDQVETVLMIGPARPAQRDQVALALAPIRTGAERAMPKALVIVATQCIEAGVDIDLDALFTEAAPLDCLRQRFGRLNRDGRAVTVCAAIVAIKEEIGARSIDPVYGEALREAWAALGSGASSHGKNKEPAVDFGLSRFQVPMAPQALSPKPDAPVLMPAHLDLLAQTSPIPAAGPDVALHLHGPSRQPDAITVVWRADIDLGLNPASVRDLLMLVPPRTGEAIGLPVWAVRSWLDGDARATQQLADISTRDPHEQKRHTEDRRVFRWSGLDDRSRWVTPGELRPGDTIVVPAAYGGVDAYGWHPDSSEPAADLAEAAAAGHRGRRFAVRVAQGLVGEAVSPQALGSALAAVRNEPWESVRAALMALPLPEERRSLLQLLDRARGRPGRARVDVRFDPYDIVADSEPRGVVFLAPYGLADEAEAEEGRPNSTEDDASGSLYGFAQTLAEHSAQVESKAEAFARLAGLPAQRIADLKLAGFLHDEGKRDVRFQRWMHHGDPLGADPEDETTILAKSGRALPPAARDKAGLPPRWRHEALSVRLARAHERLQAASDPDLVLWLIGTHHGYGRPLYPHADPAEAAPAVGPQSLAFDWKGMDWAKLYQVLKARYGVWELAHMEAILRLADHRASEDAARGRTDE